MRRMLAHLALAIAPILTPAATPAAHTLTALAPIEIWASGLGDPRGIAVDAHGHVWVTDHARGLLLRLDGLGAARVVARGLRGPLGAAVDGAGRLLIAEETGGRVVRVSAAGAVSVVASGLDGPRWLAVAEDDTIYVSVKRGVLALRAAERPALVVHGLRDPEGLAVRDGVLYVATRGREPGHHDPILRIALAADGRARVTEHTDGTLRKPVGLALDATGAVFVAATRLVLPDDHVAGVIAKLDPTGASDVFSAGAEDPQGLAFDGDGHLYLVDRQAGRVVRFLAPGAPALDPAPAWTRAPSVTLSGRTEPEARIEAVSDQVTAEGPADRAGRFAVTLPLAANTVSRFAVRAIGHDGAGLASPAVAVAIGHDAAAPRLALDSPPSGASVRGTVAIHATAADEGSHVASLELLAAGQPLTPAVAPPLPAAAATASAAWDSTSAADGVHTLTARASDRAGNAASVSRAVTVDNTPPETRVSGPDDRPEGLRFSFVGSDNLTPADALEFAWRLDERAWSPFAPLTTTTLADLTTGTHRIEVAARDRAGNVDPTPAALTFAVAGGGLGVSILEPAPGAVVPAGTVLVRGRLDAAGDDVGVTVNGLPGWLQGAAFTALAIIDPTTTAIVATAVAPDGRTGHASIPVTVAEAPPVILLASPWNGPAPLTVRLSLPRDPGTARVELDADGDGVTDFTGDTLDEYVATYAQPGVYVARAIVTDTGGAAATATAVVQVFDGAALDGQLRAKWGAMKEALRRGDIATGVSHIVQRRRSDYETAFRLLGSSLPAIDTLLTDITLEQVRNAAALYEMRRTDDGVPKSFQVRFAIDGDGVWRLEAF
jgi:glucose/arabinose dehydrogenase